MNHEITVRRAEKEDVMQIAEILVEDWQTAYRGIMDDEFLDSMSAEQRYEIEVRRYQKFIVAADGDEILGYAWLEASDEEPADCAALLGMSTAAMAQATYEAADGTKYEFKKHAFLDLQGGIQHTLGEAKFKDLSAGDDDELPFD